MVPSDWYQENMFLKIQPLHWCKYTLNSIPGSNTHIAIRKMRQKRNNVLCWGKKSAVTEHSILTGQLRRTEGVWDTISLTCPSTEHEGDTTILRHTHKSPQKDLLCTL